MILDSDGDEDTPGPSNPPRQPGEGCSRGGGDDDDEWRRRLHAVLQPPQHGKLQGRRVARSGEGDGEERTSSFFLNILNMNELAEVWLNLRRVCAGTYIFKKSGRRDWGTSRPQHAVSPDAFPGGDF